MGAWAAGALAGAAGSVASQAAGNILGTQHGFDWKQVAVGAVTGAIGGGLAAEFSEGGAFASTFASEAGNGISVAGNLLIGAASYVGTYETEKLLGMPAHFSWAGLIASSVASAAAGKLGPTNEESKAGLSSQDWVSKVEANAVQDVTTREVSLALGDDHVKSWQEIGEDSRAAAEYEPSIGCR